MASVASGRRTLQFPVLPVLCILVSFQVHSKGNEEIAKRSGSDEEVLPFSGNQVQVHDISDYWKAKAAAEPVHLLPAPVSTVTARRATTATMCKDSKVVSFTFAHKTLIVDFCQPVEYSSDAVVWLEQFTVERGKTWTAIAWQSHYVVLKNDETRMIVDLSSFIDPGTRFTVHLPGGVIIGDNGTALEEISSNELRVPTVTSTTFTTTSSTTTFVTTLATDFTRTLISRNTWWRALALCVGGLFLSCFGFWVWWRCCTKRKTSSKSRTSGICRSLCKACVTCRCRRRRSTRKSPVSPMAASKIVNKEELCNKIRDDYVVEDELTPSELDVLRQLEAGSIASSSSLMSSSVEFEKAGKRPPSFGFGSTRSGTLTQSNVAVLDLNKISSLLEDDQVSFGEPCTFGQAGDMTLSSHRDDEDVSGPPTPEDALGNSGKCFSRQADCATNARVGTSHGQGLRIASGTHEGPARSSVAFAALRKKAMPTQLDTPRSTPPSSPASTRGRLRRLGTPSSGAPSATPTGTLVSVLTPSTLTASPIVRWGSGPDFGDEWQAGRERQSFAQGLGEVIRALDLAGDHALLADLSPSSSRRSARRASERASWKEAGAGCPLELSTPQSSMADTLRLHRVDEGNGLVSPPESSRSLGALEGHVRIAGAGSEPMDLNTPLSRKDSEDIAYSDKFEEEVASSVMDDAENET